MPARASIPCRKKMWNMAGDGLVLSLEVLFVQGRVDVVLSWWSSLLSLVPTVACADRGACHQGRVFELAPLPCASQFRRLRSRNWKLEISRQPVFRSPGPGCACRPGQPSSVPRRGWLPGCLPRVDGDFRLPWKDFIAIACLWPSQSNQF
jgi:hypothetical protein